MSKSRSPNSASSSAAAARARTHAAAGNGPVRTSQEVESKLSVPARGGAEVGSGVVVGAGAGPGPETIVDYASAQRYLGARVDLERVRPTTETRDAYKLDRMRAILDALGNPHESIRCVHIAGTKGKGSTCEMTASCLEACGYTVGLFTSPHLVDLRERVRINRAMISEAEFVAVLKKVAEAAAPVTRVMGEATFFELMTALGFQHFAEQAVDVGVIEVGLGGKLDCTNVITPEVAAITTIGFDHTQILGNTLAEIATQKAGIFKTGVPALTVDQHPEALAAIRKAAEELAVPLQVVGASGDLEFSHRFEWPADAAARRAGHTEFGPTLLVNLTTEHAVYEHVSVPLRGEHQAINCGLALAIIDKLNERGFNCPEELVLAGLERTRLPGRFEQVYPNPPPFVILDGAHNPDSMRALMKALSAYLQFDSLVVLFGCAADKDIDSMLRALAGGADKVIFTRASGNARAANPADLARRYGELSEGKICQTSNSLAQGLELAARALGRGDALCITGSFYIVGEAKAELARREAARAAAAKSHK